MSIIGSNVLTTFPSHSTTDSKSVDVLRIDSRLAERVISICRGTAKREARLLRQLGMDPHDLAGEVMLRICRRPPRIPPIAVGSYLRRTVRNVLVDGWRRRRAENDRLLHFAHSCPTTKGADVQQEIEALQSEHRQQFVKLLACLPPSHREVIELAWLGVSGKEAARHLSVAESTYSERKSKVIRELRSLNVLHSREASKRGGPSSAAPN